MSKTIKKILINNARPNMVLAKDIISDSGLVLIGENTILTERSILKLKVYDINTIYIKELNPDSIDLTNNEAVDEESIENWQRPITETEEFKKFYDQYEIHEHLAVKCLKSIGSGSEANISEIYSITSTIMGSLLTKSDLFKFLHHLKERDDYTFTHCVNVSLLCNLFGFWIGLNPEGIVNLTAAGMLHDIGKTLINPEILNKPSKLTRDEFEEVKKHSIYGFRMIKEQYLPEPVKMAVLMHHERLDASGYPMGATDKQIGDFSKIVAIADMYEAMSSKRPYRDKKCPFDVIKILESSYLSKLDTKYLLIFLEKIAYNYVGSKVLLNTGEQAEVVFINKARLSSPIVKTRNDYFLDLSTNKDLVITELL